LTPRQKIMVVVPVVACLVLLLVYLGLFSNPLVILVIFALYVAVSLRNRRKFGPRKEKG
jgi:hypothetical protein